MSHKFRFRKTAAYPVENIRVGDDGKFKAFQVLRCMSRQPACKEELRIAIPPAGFHPDQAIVKLAHQRGWMADRRGYCLCPLHTPWAKRGGEPSNMAPEQKRAAYCAIRDRDMAAAAANDRQPVATIGVRDMESETRKADAAIARAERDPRVGPATLRAFKAIVPPIRRAAFNKGWRRAAADSIGMHETTFSRHVKRLVDLGYLVKIPNSFKLIITHKEEPTMINDEPETAAETAAADDSVAATMPVEAPRQATREDKRRIREFLDGHYDERDGRWCDDWSDAKAGSHLNMPRAWVSAIRDEFYGEDINEADDRRTEQAGELAVTAAKLRDDAMAIAVRAEELEAACRKLMGEQ